MEPEAEVTGEEEIVVAPELPEGGNDEGGAQPDDEATFWNNLDKEEAGAEEVPVSTHLRIKDKLKGRIREKDSEIEDLRRELNEIKANRAPVMAATMKRPKEDDFETTEEYDAALDKYEESRLASLAGRTQQAEQVKKAVEARGVAVESHYKRADEFVTKYGIAPEKYKTADESIRKAVDTVLPGQGEVVTDHLISLLGEGSEKVLFRVGAKPEVLREFQSLLIEDKTGLKAGIFLGRQLELITNPKKRISNAPPPSRQLKGDAVPDANAATLKKSYLEAHKKGDSQKAFDIRKQARTAGVNVKEW